MSNQGRRASRAESLRSEDRNIELRQDKDYFTFRELNNDDDDGDQMGGGGEELGYRVNSGGGDSLRSLKSSVQSTSSFEVLEPVGTGEMGRIDQRRLTETIESRLPSTDEKPLDSSTAMTFFVQNGPLITVTKFSDLKGRQITDVIANHIFWLDVDGYNEEILAVLAEIFGIHPLTLDDMLADETREKCEYFEGYIFMCIKVLLFSFEQRATWMSTDNLYLICSTKFVISLHSERLPGILEIRERLNKLVSITITAGWILYAILDNFIDAFVGPVNQLEMECRAIEELVMLLNEDDRNEVIRRIGNARKQVSVAQRLVSSKIEILKMMQIRQSVLQKKLIESEVFLYLEDVKSHLDSMDHLLTSSFETVNRSHSLYLSHLSVVLSYSSNKVGEAAKKFTFIACLFLPLNLVAALWGVNLRVRYVLLVYISFKAPFLNLMIFSD